MKRTVVIMLLLVLALTVAPAAFGQAGITYSSGFQVQNLSNTTAAITVTFFNQNGDTAGSVNGSIPAGANVTYFPIPNVPDGFNGSAVISSDQPVAAITNLLGNYPQYGGSTTGFTEGSNNVGLPLIMRGNSGFDTWFNVQNTGTADANVTITYTPGDAGSPHTETATIRPGAAKTFNQASTPTLGTKFVGSARVTSDQPVAAMVNQVGTGGVKALLMYDGFTGGSNEARAPLIMANNSGFFTSLNIQNVGNAAATVNINYGPNTGGGFTPAPESCATLAAGGSCVRLQSGGQWGANKYVGSATLTSAQPIVVVVNQLRIGNPVSFGTAYEGFNPANLSSKVSAPLIMANNAGFFTSVNVQNSGNTNTTVTIRYSPNTAGPFTPANESCNLAPGESCNRLQSGGQWGTNKYVGSATIESTGNAPLAVIINELNLTAAGDQFLTYNAINY